MKNSFFAIVLFMLISAAGFGQIQLTEKQIKRNYQEVKGNISLSKDSLPPDRYAMYPKGIDGIYIHIKAIMTYPFEAYTNRITGEVHVKFVIDANGKIRDVEVVKSAHPLLDAEAVRVIKCMTGWLPGYKNGVPVKTSYIFPMIFGLQQ